MALDGVLHFNQPPRTEAEALLERQNPEIVRTARSIERTRLELSNDSLMVERGPDYRRWEALMNGAAPAAWAVEEAKAEAEKPKAMVALRVTVTEGSRVCVDREQMTREEVFEDFHLSGADQFKVDFAIQDGRAITLGLVGTLRFVKIEPCDGNGT